MKKVYRYALIPLVIALLFLVGMFATPSKRTGSAFVTEATDAATTPGGKSSKDDPVSATVNGEAIHESDLAWKPSKGSFDADPTEVRDVRLERMIDTLALRQFLRDAKVTVPEADLDKAVAELRKYPPTAGCACCRYESLEQFMDANNLDLKELRSILTNDLGLQKYVLAQWDKDNPPGPARAEKIRAERPRLEEQYVKISHIFFKTYQNPKFATNPEEARKAALAKAQAAWDDVRKGKAFEDVAKASSEDAVSAPKGGSLGCVSSNAFGQDFARVVAKLKPGEISKPFESPWGYHVVRRDTVTDDDVMDLLKSEYEDGKRADVLNSVKAEAKVVR